MPRVGKGKPAVAAAAAAGSLSGTVASVALQPFDVMRTRLQAGSLQPTQQLPQLARSIMLAEGGVRGLWAGGSMAAARIMVGAGVYFPILTLQRAWMAPYMQGGDSQLGSTAQAALTFAVGSSARVLATAVAMPLTVIKTRLEAGLAGGSSSTTLLGIARSQGFRGLMAGFLPSIARDGPYSGLYLLFYTSLQSQLAAVSGDSVPQVAVNFAAGSLGAAVATVLTHPADVVRAQQQLCTAGSKQLPALAALRKQWAAHGLPGMFRGLLPRMMKRPLHTGIVWMLYEELYAAFTSNDT